MPASTAFGWALHNLGPLTTTFTAPSSCATFTDNVLIAPASAPDAVQFQVSCGAWERGDCFPSGSSIDASISALNTDNPGAGYFIDYFSPGLMCPSGWTTAGLATKSKGGDITSSGPAFVVPTTETISSSMKLFENPQPNILLSAMDEEETAILCCPSSMTGDLDGQCTSVMSSYTVSSGCARMVPTEDADTYTTALSVFGTTVTAYILTYVNTLPVSETVQTTFAASEASEYIGVAAMPMVTLIHHGSDSATASTTSGGSDASGTGTATVSGTSSSTPNAGVSARMSPVVPGLGLSLLVCAVAMTVGSALLFAI